MKKGYIATLLTLAVFLVAGIPHTAFAKQLINSVRVDASSPDVDRIIFELSGVTGPYLPKGKPLPGSNPRVYFDFLEAAPAAKFKNRIATGGNFVKQIRHAYHKSPKPKTRVVFDLVADKKMAFSQDFDSSSNTLTISLYLAGTTPDPARPAPPAKPKAAVVKKPEPPQPKPPVAKKTVPPPQPKSKTAKKVKPIAEVSIAPKPEPKPEPKPKPVAPPPPKPKPEPKVAVVKEKPAAKPTPPPKPEPKAVVVKEKPVAKTAVQPPKPKPEPKPAPQPEQPKVASIPPPPSISSPPGPPPEEATDIKPMAEVGATQQKPMDATPILHGIEFDPQSKRGETISFKLNGFHPPVVFGIEEDIPRIVCFFKNASAGKELRDVIGAGGKNVQTIKVGKYQNPDNIRVVLELLPGYNYDLQQVFFKDDNVFMLIVNKAGKQKPSKNT